MVFKGAHQRHLSGVVRRGDRGQKIFMDEHTGTLDESAWKEVNRALEAAAGCLDELGR